MSGGKARPGCLQCHGEEEILMGCRENATRREVAFSEK